MENSFPCKNCGVTFESAKVFLDHFIREGAAIVGCSPIGSSTNPSSSDVKSIPRRVEKVEA